MSGPSVVQLPIEHVRVGVTCRYPIHDSDGILLLGSGTQISDRIIDNLRSRSVEAIFVHPSDATSLAVSENSDGDKSSSAPMTRFTGSWEPSVSMKEMLMDRFNEPLSQKRGETIQRGLMAAKVRFSQVEQRIKDRDFHSAEPIATISDAFARSILDDHDQTVGQLGEASPDVDLAQQCVKMAVLGMAVAAEMELDGPSTLEVGLTALLHDIGFLILDPKLRDPRAKLTEAERWEYEKHPLISCECISHIAEIPPSVRLAVGQVHEQFNGGGFPRALRGPRIHLYARILNVVDAYLQLISPASNRCGIVPHDALGFILHQGPKGIFDPEVLRAFLKVESLFPLGSQVELQSGEEARVIRRSPHSYATPVLEGADGNRINCDSSDNKIVRPKLDSSLDQMRIPISIMGKLSWNPADNLLLV